MKTNIRVALTVFAGAFVLGGIAACSRQSDSRDIDWARAALARNPQFEIMATDEKARVFTVRDATDGSVRTLRIDELIAAPPAPKVAAAPAPQPAEAPPAAVPADASPEADLAAAPPEQTTETVAAERTGGGEPLAEGPGYSISRSAGASQAASTLEGPGYSITREQPATGQAAARAEVAATVNVQRRNEPIRCQGNRLMRIDGETFEFSGDAVIAEDGCDLYISNARIRANGVGIIARQARVHIVNSTIGGTRGSYEVSDGAEIYVARSTFAGVGRRFDTATMNDLGGNQYRLNH
jgi:hypothetical protein